MKNLFKICTLIFLIFLLFITCVNASNINMNLQSNEINSAVDENLVEDEYTFNETNITENATIDESSNVNTYDPVDTPRVTSTTTSEDKEFLTVENILSIIIIVIGILLTLLAGAILIRIK